ncbi:MAG: HDOD domain-containing protein [Candidatus Accumulibacter sp.]|jgi:EAL and modified HD-GYP domain-containing signal transduction protein|nr:HDOD domain-containing protein [Accumulibacter sp.]
MSAPYFFFRPILAPDRSWAALDWQTESLAETDFAAFIQCFADSAAAPLVRTMPLVAPIQAEFLLQDKFLDAFNSEPVIFVLPESCLANGPVNARCKVLRAQAKPLALQIESLETMRKIAPGAFHALCFDAAFARQKLTAPDIERLGEVGFKTIATRVDSYDLFEWLIQKGVRWADSHFLTAPNPQLGETSDLACLDVLKPLSLIKQDTDLREIESIFREEAGFSYYLLRLVNSVAIGTRVKIGNFSQTVAILGRHQLQRWLQLSIYANNLVNDPASNPLMQLAAARGRQMELLSAAIDPIHDVPELADNAFMTGMFSLIGVLVNLPMKEILNKLPLQDAVIEALNNPAGDSVLGKLLAAIVAGESGDFTLAARLLAELGIGPAIHAKSQVTAFYWASRINVGGNDQINRKRGAIQVKPASAANANNKN